MMCFPKMVVALATVTAAVLPVASCQAQTRAATKPMIGVKPVAPSADMPFPGLTLIDEIDCGAATPGANFQEMPQGVSKVEMLLGKQCRVLPNSGDAKYFAYRIGKGKNLKPGNAYFLAVDFPEDKPRSLFIVNRGADMVRGVHTGNTLGDVFHTFTNNNSESLQIPLSGTFRTWKSLFFMHEHLFEFGMKSDDAGKEGVPRSGKPEDGFWVAIAQSKGDNDPTSAGAAVARIRLYAVSDATNLNQPLRLPPASLPQRHLFWREEMADGVISPDKPEDRGVENQVAWYEYKARLMQFLGMNTFSKDLLEFGHNQGWDAGPTNDWYNASHYPELWGDILTMLAKYPFTVLPYYEYAGSVGQKSLGIEKRAKTLGGEKDFTHIWWTEGYNADITDPDTLTDARKLLDATIVRYKDRVPFLGAWFRPRPSQFPIGFGDPTLARFAKEANNNQAVTREQLKSDKALLDRYYVWWFGKRREFLLSLRDYLRTQGIAGADILLTPDSAEPGRSLVGQQAVVTDDVPAWSTILQQPAHKNTRAVSYAETVAQNKQLEALTTPTPTWDKWEWQHANPQADPLAYQNTEGALLTYSFNRAYTVSSAKGFDAFRTRSGLAAILHYPLNEKSMETSLGYIASDMEYAGPYCMLPEARAVAYGDPDLIGYLASSSFNRGFPEYARAFNAAYLALPALPSKMLPDASPDKEVIVRAINTPKNGTYLAIVNTSLMDKQVTITLPTNGKVINAATGQALTAKNGKLELTFYACELKAVYIP